MTDPKAERTARILANIIVDFFIPAIGLLLLIVLIPPVRHAFWAGVTMGWTP